MSEDERTATFLDRMDEVLGLRDKIKKLQSAISEVYEAERDDVTDDKPLKEAIKRVSKGLEHWEPFDDQVRVFTNAWLARTHARAREGLTADNPPAEAPPVSRGVVANPDPQETARAERLANMQT